MRSPELFKATTRKLILVPHVDKIGSISTASCRIGIILLRAFVLEASERQMQLVFHSIFRF